MINNSNIQRYLNNNQVLNSAQYAEWNQDDVGFGAPFHAGISASLHVGMGKSIQYRLRRPQNPMHVSWTAWNRLGDV